MIANVENYSKMYGNVFGGEFSMAKCACVSCNSCTCACSCRGIARFEDIEW